MRWFCDWGNGPSVLPVVLSGAGVKVASSAFTCDCLVVDINSDWRRRRDRRSGIVLSGTMVSFILDTGI